MKAKEYLEEYLKDTRPENERLADVVIKFAQEIKTIGDARHARSEDSFVSIVKEQDDKWKAFVRKTIPGKDGALDGSFMNCLKVMMPGVWQAVQVIEFRRRDRAGRRW